MVNAYEILNEKIMAVALHLDKVSSHCLLNVFLELRVFMNVVFFFHGPPSFYDLSET